MPLLPYLRFLYAGLAGGFLIVSLTSARAADSTQAILDKSIKPVPTAPANGRVNAHKAFISRNALTAAESAAPMPFEVILKIRDVDGLRARVDKGEQISAQDMEAKYDPLPTDYEAAINWLTGEGLTIMRRDPHHMAIFAKGTVGQIQKATGASFARVTLQGKEYTSAVTPPSVPAAISSHLVGINGLQPHLRAHPHLLRPDASGGDASYTPAQIAKAYQANGLYTSNITGSGQTIAIVIDTFPSTGDLITFWQTNGVNQTIDNMQFVQAVAGDMGVPSVESTLDTEWSSSIAPGAKVRVYAALDLANADLDAAYQQVYEDATTHPEYAIHQMSMSYGEGEDVTTPSQIETDDQYFVKLTGAGVTCFASSGDNGSTPGDAQTGEETENGDLQAETPASDPNVISVGGTTLTLDANNNESSEVVWNNDIGASGGGTSTIFGRPSWQTGTGVPAGTMRLVPDIACSADPDFGANVTYAGSSTVVGGTSWSSPTCAGFCALINQARANLGLSAIGQMGPHLYPLLGTNNFRDIITGNNATAVSQGLYSAGVGYDEATGIGVPLVQTLAQTLASSQTLVGLSAQHPACQTVIPGGNASIVVSAGGSPTSFQWQRMPAGTTTWSNLSDGGSYAGSGTNSLSITQATAAMSGDQFQCVVTYASGPTLTSTPPNILVVDTPWTIGTLAGTNSFTGGFFSSTGTSAQFNYPTGIAIDTSGNLFIADLTNNAIRKITPAGVVTTPYGSLSGTAGSTNASGNNALFSSPRDIAIDASNNLYVADEGNNLIRKITVSTGAVTTLASTARFNSPRGVAVDHSGNVYVTDSVNNTIRKISTTGAVTTIAGTTTVAGYRDATGAQALFNQPIGIAVDASGNIYVADYGNAAVRKITSAGVVTTLAGQGGAGGYLDGPGSTALFNLPRDITVDSAGNLYVTDSYAPVVQPPPEFAGNNLLRKITPTGIVSTLAGQPGIAGSVDASGSAGLFYNPIGVAMNSSGELFISDAGNNIIRTAFAESSISISATQPYASPNGPISGQFTVTRTGSTASSLTVNYSVSGTAVSGVDYSALPGSVTIPAGAASTTITLNPLSDTQATGSRTVILTLTTTAGAVVSPTPATISISEGQPQTFSQWETSFSVSSTMTATPESDGVPNLLKYLFDIDPSGTMTPTDRSALPALGMTTNGGAEYLTLTYRQYALATGITVNVQSSPDLQTWTTVTNPTTVLMGTDTTTGDPIFQVQVPVTTALQFLRLDVTSP